MLTDDRIALYQLTFAKHNNRANWVTPGTSLPNSTSFSFLPPEPCPEAQALAEQFAQEKTKCFGIQMNQDTSECVKFWPLLAHTINNLGDPFRGKGGHLVTFEAERELVYLVADLLHLERRNTWGYFTPGSTYSNLHGVHLGMSRFHEPALVIAEDAHYSLMKAARITRCHKVIKVQTDPFGRMDPQHLYENIRQYGIDQKYIFAFCSGSVAKGAYDDIESLLFAIKDSGLPSNSYHVHLDAALGGMVTPFLDEHPLPLDFSTVEVDSLSVSFHKRIGIPSPGSLFLARQSILGNSPFADYIDSPDTTLGGSRDGLMPFITLQILKRVGVEGMKKRTQQALEKAKRLTALLREKDIDAWHNDYSPCVILPAPSPTFSKTYHLPLFKGSKEEFTHVFTLEHIQEEVMEQFVRQYTQDPVIRHLQKSRTYSQQ